MVSILFPSFITCDELLPFFRFPFFFFFFFLLAFVLLSVSFDGDEVIAFNNCGLVAPSIHEAEQLWTTLPLHLAKTVFHEYDIELYFTLKFIDIYGETIKTGILSLTVAWFVLYFPVKII